MENLYRTPQAQLVDAPLAGAEGHFFTTSIRKMSILFIATMGLYILYWGYKQWDSQRSRMLPKKIMPVWRSIFSIFYMHSLSGLIDEQLRQQGKPLLGSGPATLYVVVAVGSAVLGQVSSRIEELPVLLDVFLMLLQLCILLPMISIQRQANLASQDPQGSSNAQMSGANIGFIVAGVLFWCLYLGSIATLLILGVPA